MRNVIKTLQFWKKQDFKIFWFGFYGHLKMRKFRNFEDFRKLTIFKIFAKSTTFFFSNIFCFSMNFRTSFTSCRENWTFFRPKKCIFCETYIVGDEKIQKKLIFAIFFFKMAKKGSEKLKCSDLFFFYSILPPKKWGKTIESLLTFPKIEISGLLACGHS